MILTNQQKYIIGVLRQLKYLRVRQLHALVRAHYLPQGIEIGEQRMDAMLRQLRTVSSSIFLQGDLVMYGKREISDRYLEAIDVMLELTENEPTFYSCEQLREPFLLRFGSSGVLFRVIWLDAPSRIAATSRAKGERLIWLTDRADVGGIVLPHHHFFAVRQEDGTHRFYGSTEPKKNKNQEV